MVVYLGFNYAFDFVKYQCLLYHLKLMCIVGAIFNIFKDFLTNCKQCVSVNGNFSKFNSVAVGVLQVSVLGLLLNIL